MNPNWRNRYLRYKTFFLNVLLRYKDKPQIRAYLEILLSLATISIFGVFAIKPTALTIAQLLKEIEEKKATLATMEEKISNLRIASNVHNQNLEKIALLETSIPKRPKPEDFAKQVEGLSGKNSVELIKVSTSGGLLTGERTQADSFENLGFSIGTRVLVDNFAQMSGFTSDLLNNLRNPISISSIRFDSQSEKDRRTIILNINGEIPYKP